VAPLPSPLQGLRLWLMADNVRQGAAQHSFYVLKTWIKDF
jgi:aspartate-semialdehyde dehydrogenase